MRTFVLLVAVALLVVPVAADEAVTADAREGFGTEISVTATVTGVQLFARRDSQGKLAGVVTYLVTASAPPIFCDIPECASARPGMVVEMTGHTYIETRGIVPFAAAAGTIILREPEPNCEQGVACQ